MDSELDEAANDNIRFHVWSGYYDQDEVLSIAFDEVDVEDEDRLRDAVDREFSLKKAAERNWPAVTDCDRLDNVFQSLAVRGILCRHRCGMTIQDGLEVIEELYSDARSAKREWIGYCFYDLQDMESAMWGKAGLRLAFGSFPLSHEHASQVGQIVKEEFKQAGFSVEWDETSNSRLQLDGFKWQRRGPT